MKKQVFLLLTGCLFLASCNQQQNAIKLQLDSIQIMIKQAALLAGEAVCSDAMSRNALIHAAAVMDRRAMGGSEMAKIHKMMNMQADATGGMKKDTDVNASLEMQQHVALHDAGEGVFDFLDGMGSGDVSCKQAAPMQLAASAAMLREVGGQEAKDTVTELDARVAELLAEKKMPEVVRALAKALRRI